MANDTPGTDESLRILAAPANNLVELLTNHLDAMSLDGGVLWLRKQNRLHTKLIIARDRTGQLIRERGGVDLKLGEGVAGHVAKMRCGASFGDITNPRERDAFGVSKMGHPEFVRKHRWRSAHFLPILSGEKLLGVVGVYLGEPTDSVSLRDVWMDRVLADRLVAKIRILDLNSRHERMVAVGTESMARAHDVREELINTQIPFLKLQRSAQLRSNPELQRHLKLLGERLTVLKSWSTRL